MTTSTAVQHRIITAFPKIATWKNYQLVLSLLVAFFNGEKIRINEGWKNSRGHSSLLANAKGRRVLKILKAVNARVEFGNDAARGGAVGAYFKCLRKNARAANFFGDLLFLQKQRLNDFED